MAVIDPLTDAVVIRVIYDGAPFAGKTTSVRALGSGLGSTVTSPGEIAGRTLFFDWLDYTGGLFEGRRIRCQIVSVPGQAVLAPRRKRLLDSADVVVYVLDSSAAAFASERGYLEGLKATLNRRSGPPVGIVVQANKRDLPDAVALIDLRQMLESVGFTAAVVETNAAAGLGIRESFVLAVRLALDRVRELLRSGKLVTAPPDINDHQALLDDLQSHDQALASLNELQELPHTRMSDLAVTVSNTAGRVAGNVSAAIAPLAPPPQAVDEESHPTTTARTQSATPAAVPLAAQALMEALADNQDAATTPAAVPTPTDATAVAAVDAVDAVAAPSPHPPVDRRQDNGDEATQPPLAPDDRVASGLIWPVVVGRTILNEITQQPWHPTQTADGAWRGDVAGRWRLCSHPRASFADVEHGRERLVQWARMHVAAASILTADRCIVLSNDHQGSVRLWQVYRQEQSLAAQLRSAAASHNSQDFAIALLASSIALSEIRSRLQVIDFDVVAGLNDLALREHRVVFCGSMPAPGEAKPGIRGALVDATGAGFEADFVAEFDAEFEAIRSQLDARRCELAAFLEQPAAVIKQAVHTPDTDASPLASFVRQASPDRLDQAILQLTALMVAA